MRKLVPVFAALAVVAVQLLWWVLTPRGTIETDVGYYWAYVSLVPEHGFGPVLPEYPLPAAILLWLPTLFVSTFPAYFNVFWLVNAALCLVFAWALWRVGERPALIWLAGLAAAGPLSLFRFDLWPGLLVALALWNYARPVRWSVLLAAGTALKVWPVLIWPLGGWKWRRLWPALLSAVLVVGVCLAIAGPERLLSPFTWQGERGLHIEALLALWILVARLFTDRWEAGLSDNNSVDFTGPGVQATLVVGSVLWVLFIAAALALAWWVGRHRSVTAVALAVNWVLWTMLAVNKVFSPQYLMWALPAFAVLWLVARRPLPRWWIPAVLMISFLTGLTYPLFYDYLFNGPAWVATVGLVVRGVLLVALSVSLAVRIRDVSTERGTHVARHHSGRRRRHAPVAAVSPKPAQVSAGPARSRADAAAGDI